MVNRRICTLAAFGALATLLAPVASRAADGDYPNKPITIIVPYAPGGQGDVFARLIGERLGVRLKQTVLVDNRPGATGALGARLVARAPADGYTLLLGQTGEIAVNKFVVKQLGYDPLKDFRAVALVGDAPLVLAAPANAAFNTLQDLQKLAKSKPGSVTYASSGNATPGHLAAAAMALGMKIDMVHVPYKGAGQAMTDLLGGHVQMFFVSASAVMPQVKAGKLKALAVSTPARMAAYPQIPTVTESGLPGFSYSLWGGFFAPAATSDVVVNLLNQEINAILAEPAIRGRLEADGIVIQKNSPAEFSRFVDVEAHKYEQLVKQTGISAE